MKKARITYRFNHYDSFKEPPDGENRHLSRKVVSYYQNEWEKKEETRGEKQEQSEQQERIRNEQDAPLQLNHFTSDFGDWYSPFEAETQRLDRLAYGAKAEDRAKKQQKTEENRDPEQEFNREPQTQPAAYDHRHDPEQEYLGPFLYEEPTVRTRYSRSSGPPWMKIGLSVASAVLTGVFLGFFVLSMFSGEIGNDPGDPASRQSSSGQDTETGRQGPEDGGSSNAVSGSGNTTPIPAPSADGNAGQDAFASKETVSLNLPTQSFSFLQNGVFSTREGADLVQSQLREKGLAAMTEEGDKFAVYVGVAANREEAAALGRKLQDGQLEIFVKNYTLPAVAEVNWAGANPESLSRYLTSGNELVSLIGRLTIAQLTAAQPEALDSGELQSVKTLHQTWTPLANAVSSDAPDDAGPFVQQMNNGLNTAVISLDAYRKNQSASYLWEAQTAIMQYIIAQKQLLSKISAQG